VMGAWRFLTLSMVAVCAVAPSVRADDLIMPYTCEMDRGTPRLMASSATVYHIFGQPDGQTFSVCAPSPSGTCETMMVHKFTIECSGQRVAWSRVAASARALGVDLPEHLPPGYAPVSRLAGRFVLPGFARATTPAITRVAMQELSPDGVIEMSRPRARRETAQWVTVVDSEVMGASSGEAFKVAGVVATLLMTLMAASLIVARGGARLSFDLAGLSGAAGALANSALHILTLGLARAQAAFRHSYESWQAAADGEGGDAHLANALSLVHARLGETEFLVATLPDDMLLRDVLQSELDGLRERGADIARRVGRLGAERASAMLRSLTRDLDRITRIVHGAAQRSEPDEPAAAEAPTSAYEAYRVLGLNPEAPHAAVKKVVDALRMSWHPDHARDEADRLYRERRIKQINAAWDILKGGRAAAA
jgi:hypothetical protein